MAAGLPAEDLDQTLLLRLAGAVIDIDGDLPLALVHLARRVRGERNVETGQIDLVVRALVDMPAEDDGAVPLRRWAEERARARRLAITALEVGPTHRPRHGVSFPRNLSSGLSAHPEGWRRRSMSGGDASPLCAPRYKAITGVRSARSGGGARR